MKSCLCSRGSNAGSKSVPTFSIRIFLPKRTADSNVRIKSLSTNLTTWIPLSLPYNVFRLGIGTFFFQELKKKEVTTPFPIVVQKRSDDFTNASVVIQISQLYFRKRQLYFRLVIFRFELVNYCNLESVNCNF